MNSHTFFCIDAHTCGNPVRVVAGGAPVLAGATASERRQHFLKHFDWIRTGLMFEPRGHDIMSGSILYPPTRPDCDAGILFIETSGCLPMCGHGTIGTVTMAIENGLVAPATPGVVNLDAPAGRVVARYEQNGRFVDSVRITNVASYLAASEIAVDVPGIGAIRTLRVSRRERPYCHALAVATNKPCYGPPLGTSTNYADKDPYRPGRPVVQIFPDQAATYAFHLQVVVACTWRRLLLLPLDGGLAASGAPIEGDADGSDDPAALSQRRRCRQQEHRRYVRSGDDRRQGG
jgi:hypothetical protein